MDHDLGRLVAASGSRSFCRRARVFSVCTRWIDTPLKLKCSAKKGLQRQEIRTTVGPARVLFDSFPYLTISDLKPKDGK